MVDALARSRTRFAGLSILDRCNQTATCPKIIEHFGAAEVWGLKLTPEWVGTAADKDIPLPDNVRRYYIGSTQHGGGRGGFQHHAAGRAHVPGHRLGPRRLRHQPDAANPDGQRHPRAFARLGDEEYRAAAQRLSQAGRWHLGG